MMVYNLHATSHSPCLTQTSFRVTPVTLANMAMLAITCFSLRFLWRVWPKLISDEKGIAMSFVIIIIALGHIFLLLDSYLQHNTTFTTFNFVLMLQQLSPTGQHKDSLN